MILWKRNNGQELCGLTYKDKVSNELTLVKLGGDESSGHSNSRTNRTVMYNNLPFPININVYAHYMSMDNYPL